MTTRFIDSLGFFLMTVCVAPLLGGMLIGYGVRGRSLAKVTAIDNYEDCLIHPETTPEVKWLRMTKPTQQALLAIYAENMDECSKFQQKNDRVTIGEAAILWLITKREAVDER